LNDIRYISVLIFGHPPIPTDDLRHPVGHGCDGVYGVEGKSQNPPQGALLHLQLGSDLAERHLSLPELDGSPFVILLEGLV
jgi:hypothetical protein